MITVFVSAILSLPFCAAPHATQEQHDNRATLERAIEKAPIEQQAAMRWLITQMPASDTRTLTSEFLLENCAQAYHAWKSAPWHAQVSEDLFLDCILPYACINESRDPWRVTLREICAPMIVGATTPSQAAVIINRELFPRVGVKYSTLRKKADQSPAESMESGLASCTGLSILLVDACRSVGIPARFAGIPMWIDKSGNHSWVEIWDNGWHFTGAAEPTGDALDQGWFADRATGALRDEPIHAIYAVTWRDSPTTFPAAWRDDDDGVVRAVNVTDRYLTSAMVLPAGHARVRIRATADGERVALPITLCNAKSESLFSGTTKDEGFDSNDHLTATVPLGATLSLTSPGQPSLAFTVDRDEQLVTATVSASDSQRALKDLRSALGKTGVKGLTTAPFASVALTKEDAITARDLIWKSYSSRLRAQRTKELASGVIEHNGATMPIWFKAYGDKPKAGHALFISMHGGGGAPPEVNSKQWENQKRLYEPKEGIYVAPRAPTDTWNLWHQDHIDPLFTRLIEDMIIVEGINPNRVYIMGYSAGGDGVYQLAPRMADQFAAAAMMAGHPNETKPDGLRNLPFALHVGANDTPFKRNEIGAQWKVLLDELAANDVGGYPHLVEIHAGKGHWMDREDASAVEWMAQYSRNMHPTKIVWLQDDVTHTRFYWLATTVPVAGSRIVASHTGQDFLIESSATVDGLSLRMDDTMCDLDKPITVRSGDAMIFSGIAPRTIAVIATTIGERGDPTASFVAELRLAPSTLSLER